MNTLSSLLEFIASFEPVGSIKMYAGSGTPSKWLKCQGQAVSRTTYAKLFAVIGTTYGAGNGTTTFNVPDLRGRVAVGTGKGTAPDAQTRSLGYAGGSETVALTVNQMPSHTHVQNAHSHTQNPHTHSIEVNNGYHPGNGGTIAGDHAWAVDTQGVNFSGIVASATATNQATTATNQATGGGGAHFNMQPYLSVHYIIYAGK